MQKSLTTSEKMSLLQHHGEVLAGAFRGVQSPHRGDLLESAERALALIKSIPKIEFAIEE
jgi:hypothetical protein